MSKSLNPEKALIFRIVHVNNVPWILDHGLHCASSNIRDPNFITIGNEDLIAKRTTRIIPIDPHGTLQDYCPFYFSPYSPMLFNIKTGYGGVPRRDNQEIVILVSSLRQLKKLKRPFVFSDRHAYLQTARFSSELDDLNRIDWKILQDRNFKRDVDDLQKMDRYQAEALVHKHLPVEALLGAGCYDEKVAAGLKAKLAVRKIELPIHVTPSWYF